MYITAQGPRLRNDLYCVEWDVKLYYTIPYVCCFASVMQKQVNYQSTTYSTQFMIFTGERSVLYLYSKFRR